MILLSFYMRNLRRNKENYEGKENIRKFIEFTKQVGSNLRNTIEIDFQNVGHIVSKLDNFQIELGMFAFWNVEYLNN